MGGDVGSGAPSAGELERLTGKVLLDADYRNSFFANPKKAAGELNIVLTADQLEVIGSLNKEEVERLVAEQVDLIGRERLFYWLPK